MIGLKVYGIGRVCKSPEIKDLGNNKKVATVVVVYNEKYNEKETSHFFECVGFGKLADIIQKYVMKGDKIGIIGDLKEDKWETKDGKTGRKARIYLNSVELLGQKKNNDEIQSSDFYSDGDNEIEKSYF